MNVPLAQSIFVTEYSFMNFDTFFLTFLRHSKAFGEKEKKRNMMKLKNERTSVLL
jgi:hypothetical protein